MFCIFGVDGQECKAQLPEYRLYHMMITEVKVTHCSCAGLSFSDGMRPHTRNAPLMIRRFPTSGSAFQFA